MGPDEERPVRVAVVSSDPARRSVLAEQLRDLPGTELRAWAVDVPDLLLLGTRVDVCLCTEPPSDADADRLHERGCRVVVVPADGDPETALAAAVPSSSSRRAAPQLAPRQREVLLAYAAGNELLPTVARRLGMEQETLKTHLRRVRAKYAAAGRPAPTRRDLYERALEDGLLDPPSGR